MLAAANAFFLNAAVLAGPIEPGAGEAPPGSDGVVTVVKWVAWTVFALGGYWCAGDCWRNDV